MGNKDDKDDKNDKNDKNENKVKNDWKGFITSLITSLITVLLIGLLGANFVYLTRINTNLFFPTDSEQRPYTDKTKTGTPLPPLFKARGDIMTGGSSGNGCGMPIDITNSKLLENKYFKGTFDYGFPYNMENGEDTFGGVITSWFSNKVKYSYIWLRMVEKSIVTFFESLCAMSPDSARDIIPFILGPLIIGIVLAITSLWFIPAMVSVFWNENANSKFGIWISIIGLFFGWTWSVPILTSFVQIFTSMFKFILLPVLMNSSDILNIMGKSFNAWWLKLIFFILVTSAAFSKLDLYIALIMMIVFLPNVIPPGMNPLAKSKTS